MLTASPEAAIRDGFIDVPREPGLGITLDARRVEPFLFARCGG